MTSKNKTRQVADEECVLDAAEIVTFTDHDYETTAFEHLHNPAVRNELKLAGFTHAQVITNQYELKTFRLR